MTQEVPEINALLEQIKNWKGAPWLRPLTPSLTPPGGPLLHTLTGHTDGVRAVVATPDGRRAISGSDDKTLKIWDIETGAELHTLTGHTESARAVAVTSDGRRAVSGSLDATLKIWDVETGAELNTLKGHAGCVNAVAVTPDGRRAVSGSLDATLKIWDMDNWKVIACFSGEGELPACTVAPDGLSIVIGEKSSRIHILRLENVVQGPPIVTALQIPDQVLKSPAFGCPLCRMWSEIPVSALGTEIPCHHCGKPIKLNPFTINADWRQVAKAWRRGKR